MPVAFRNLERNRQYWPRLPYPASRQAVSFKRDQLVFVILLYVFGIVGYGFKKLDIPTAPLVLTFVLGPLMERGLRQSLEMSNGDFSILFTRPLSAGLLALAVVVIVAAALSAFATVRGGDAEI